MRMPIGVIKEWRRREHEKRRREDEARRPAEMPLPDAQNKRPRGYGEESGKKSRIVISLS